MNKSNSFVIYNNIYKELEIVEEIPEKFINGIADSLTDLYQHVKLNLDSSFKINSEADSDLKAAIKEFKRFIDMPLNERTEYKIQASKELLEIMPYIKTMILSL